MKLTVIIFYLLLISGINEPNAKEIIAKGQMPNVIRDKSGTLHMVYGTGDSIMYLISSDGAKKFSNPVLISRIPKLAASHTRGPQIAVNKDGLVLTACNEQGDIFSFVMSQSGNWLATGRVNDVDTVAKENLMSLSSDGSNTYAVWLDLRDGQNKIFGARSSDGGRTWSKNKMIYTSPDKTVCECCKPSVAVDGSKLYIMFRNWIDGNRDMYLIRSDDYGNSFGAAQKLGMGSWALNGCPMDGGGIVLKNGIPQTVWNRESIIYAAEPGKEEKQIGKGRNCTLEIVNGKNVYSWIEEGEVVVLKPGGEKLNLGKGQQPVLKAVDSKTVICIWENEKQIHRALVGI
jgi:hypothetical protein